MKVKELRAAIDGLDDEMKVVVFQAQCRNVHSNYVATVVDRDGDGELIVFNLNDGEEREYFYENEYNEDPHYMALVIAS